MSKVEKIILIILPLLGIVYFLPAVLMGFLGLFDTNSFAKFIGNIIIVGFFVIFLTLLLVGKLKSRKLAWSFFHS